MSAAYTPEVAATDIPIMMVTDDDLAIFEELAKTGVYTGPVGTMPRHAGELLQAIAPMDDDSGLILTVVVVNKLPVPLIEDQTGFNGVTEVPNKWDPLTQMIGNLYNRPARLDFDYDGKTPASNIGSSDEGVIPGRTDFNGTMRSGVGIYRFGVINDAGDRGTMIYGTLAFSTDDDTYGNGIGVGFMSQARSVLDIKHSIVKTEHAFAVTAALDRYDSRFAFANKYASAYTMKSLNDGVQTDKSTQEGCKITASMALFRYLSIGKVDKCGTIVMLVEPA